MKLKQRITLLYLFICIQSFSQEKTGLIWDDPAYNSSHPFYITIKGELPKQVSYEEFCPSVRDQGRSFTCVGFSCGYYLMTILEAKKRSLKKNHSINKIAISAGHIYNAVKDINDKKCEVGVRIQTALEEIKTKGTVANADFEELCRRERVVYYGYKKVYKINGYDKLFETNDKDAVKIIKLKEALVLNPVIIGMAIPTSFRFSQKIWITAPEDEKNISKLPGHSICVIGYDDSVPSDKGKGAFRVVNSFGTDWADKGFAWIPYSTMAKFARYGYRIYPSLLQTKGQTIEEDDHEIEIFDNQLSLIDKHEKVLLVNQPYEDNKIPVYEVRESLTFNDSFKLFLQNKEDLYLYAFGTDNSKRIFTLQPNFSSKLFIAQQTLRSIMSNESITLDNTKGFDYIFVIVSRTALDANSIKRKLEIENQSTPEQALRKTLNMTTSAIETELSPEGNIKFNLPNQPIGVIIKIKHI